MIPDEFSDLLAWDTRALAHVATIGPKGEPQSNPVWFEWDGQHLRFSLTTGRQKYRNLKRDPRIALSIVDPSNLYRYVELRGVVVGFDPDPNIDFISSMANKYLGKERYPWHQEGDVRVVVNVEVTRVPGT